VIQEPTLSNFKPPEQVAAPVALLLLVSCTGLGVWWPGFGVGGGGGRGKAAAGAEKQKAGAACW
jgi:hypothetical protein